MPATIGFEQQITTLTQVVEPRITKQKYYEIENLTDFVDFDYNGAYKTNLVAGRTKAHFEIDDGFSSGSPGFENSPHVNISKDIVSINNYPWRKIIHWSDFELKQAAANLISYDDLAERVDAIKKNWDLTKQQAIFCGIQRGNIDIKGLLNIPGVNSIKNILIPDGKMLKNLSPTEMHNFIAEIFDAYSKNSQIDTKPDRFIVPLSDFLGWGNTLVASPDDNNVIANPRSMIEYLEDIFKKMTQNPGFKILATKYNEAKKMKELTGTDANNRYVLYKKEAETLKFHIPLELETSNITPSSPDTFSMVCRGQIAGIMSRRPENILYIDTAEVA